MMVLPHETVDSIRITGVSIPLLNSTCVYYSFTFLY